MRVEMGFYLPNMVVRVSFFAGLDIKKLKKDPSKEERTRVIGDRALFGCLGDIFLKDLRKEKKRYKCYSKVGFSKVRIVRRRTSC